MNFIKIEKSNQFQYFINQDQTRKVLEEGKDLLQNYYLIETSDITYRIVIIKSNLHFPRQSKNNISQYQKLQSIIGCQQMLRAEILLIEYRMRAISIVAMIIKGIIQTL